MLPVWQKRLSLTMQAQTLSLENVRSVMEGCTKNEGWEKVKDVMKARLKERMRRA
jgi:hypothetical protein